MPLCPQITNTPVTVTQNSDFVVVSTTPALANTKDGLASTVISVSNNATQALSDAAAAQASAATAITNAAAAQSTANTAITNAAAAQSSANTALANAATAQSTANTAITNASAAQSSANTALTNASAAQSTANTALANAATAYTAAVGSLQPSASTIVNASNQMTAIASNGITVYSGASATTGARVVMNSLGLAGYNASNNATFSISASTGAAVFSGNVTGATITGSDLNINGKFIVNGTTGVMTATDAVITGNITATTGTFTGTVIANTGTFTGTVIATTGTFTGTVFATTGSFTGTVTATTGTFTGTVIANTGTFTGTVIATTGTFTGAVYANTGSFTGTVIATTGTFTGTVFATTGSFTGTVTATTGSFTGSVFAASGTIGGWSINSSSLSKTAGTKTMTLDSSNAILTISDSSSGILSGGGINMSAGSNTGTYGANGFSYNGNVAISASGSDLLIQGGATSAIRLQPGAGLGSTTYWVQVEGHLNSAAYTLSTGTYDSSSTALTTGTYLSASGAIIGRRNNQIPIFAHRFSTTGTSEMIRLNYNGADAGGITTTSGGVPAFRNASDYRLKSDIQDFNNAADIIKALRLRSFKYNVEPDKTAVGFIAHEMQAVLPELVLGEKDAIDEEGNPAYQSITATNLIPYLTGALKEAILRIEALEQGK